MAAGIKIKTKKRLLGCGVGHDCGDFGEDLKLIPGTITVPKE